MGNEGVDIIRISSNEDSDSKDLILLIDDIDDIGKAMRETFFADDMSNVIYEIGKKGYTVTFETMDSDAFDALRSWYDGYDDEGYAFDE